jgi:hypothetical protein
MRPRIAALLVALGVLGMVLWRLELFTVARPGERPLPLERRLAGGTLAFEVTLPRVPVGAVRVATGHGAWLVHYWAPWERHGRAQVLALDSLVRVLGPEGPRAAVVCFDPFPSVARFAARLRLGVPILLDHGREMQAVLACPSIPYTWVLDRGGRVLASQPGEVDWLAPATRALLLEAAGHGAPDSVTAAARGATDQARAVPSRIRGSQRARSAWPPKSTAL